MKKAMIFAPVHECLLDALAKNGYEAVFVEPASADFDRLLSEAQGLVTSNKLVVDRALIQRAPNLKWIGRLGSGMEIIDVAFAESNGIRCVASPAGNANAVAEQALGMYLALQHRIVKSHLEIKRGLWLRDENKGREIEGKTAGIIGFGNNGSRFARKLAALGMKVLAYDKYQAIRSEAGIVACADLTPIYEQAELLSFHVPLNQETRHYFDHAFLRAMQQSFTLLNLSRGAVVSIDALYEGMQSGKILSAALDVWEEEPYWRLPESQKWKAERLLEQDHFIGTPHIGGYSLESFYKMSKELADKLFP